MMSFDITIVYEYIPFLLKAALLTIEISILAIIVSIFFGLISALMKLSKYKSLQLIANGYVAFIRGTPLLIQLYIIYFGLPQVGIEFSAFTAAVIGLGFNGGSYVSEVFRGSIISIDYGQTEAARSLGMSSFKAMQKVVLPQAIRFSLPPMGNQFIITIKNSSLCSVITAQELMHATSRFASVNFAFLEFLLAAAILYFIMTYSTTKLIHRLEKKLSIGERRGN